MCYLHIFSVYEMIIYAFMVLESCLTNIYHPNLVMCNQSVTFVKTEAIYFCVLSF